VGIKNIYNPEDGGSMFLQNAGSCLQVHNLQFTTQKTNISTSEFFQEHDLPMCTSYVNSAGSVLIIFARDPKFPSCYFIQNGMFLMKLSEINYIKRIVSCDKCIKNFISIKIHSVFYLTFSNLYNLFIVEHNCV
jgi:hypothetical protein